jgi:hypothetical protein
MGAYKFQYRIEVMHGQDQRTVDADSVAVVEEWLIFYRANPQGGSPIEYWRVRKDLVACMETKRT